MVVFHLFEKYDIQMKDQLNLRLKQEWQKYLEEENGKMIPLQISPKIESLYG